MPVGQTLPSIHDSEPTQLTEVMAAASPGTLMQGNGTLMHLQSLLSETDLWGGKFSDVAEQLRLAAEVCLRWQDVCQKLTSLFWPHFGPHPWKGPPFVPTYLLGFTNRLQQILSVRTVHQQLLRLLFPDVSMEAVFEPFSGLHCLQYNPYTDPLWKSALAQHETRLAVFEQRAAERLRQTLTATQRDALGSGRNGSFAKRTVPSVMPKGMLARCHRLKQTTVAMASGTKQVLLGKLSEYVEDIKRRSKHGTGSEVINVPEVVKNIIDLRHLQAKLTDVVEVTETLLEDVEGCEDLLRTAREMLGEFKDQLTELFDSWSREVQALGRDKALRKVLLGKLSEYVEDIKRRSKHGTGSEVINIPEVVKNIIDLRHLQAKLTDVVEVTETLLEDVEGCEDLLRTAREMLGEFKDQLTELFDSWSREVQALGRDKALSLDANQAAMELDSRGHPVVNYSPRLVSLIREVRQLRALGYAIPAKIQALCADARKYYRQAKDLQQIAHFYSTVADHMVLSQQPLMLASAQHFTRLIGDRGRISWNDPESLDAHIAQLRGVVEKLSRENRMLRRHHFDICAKVLTLFNMDLLTKQQGWKDALTDIRSVMVKLRDQGFSSENMRPWCAHWDRQLYKALECQYLLCLETLIHHMPEIRVDLTYRSGRLQLRPPMEEVRAKYYQQVKKFLSLPVQFRGVSDDPSHKGLIFSVIADRNSHHFLGVYRRAEELFARVESASDKFEEWVALGSVNLEEFIEQSCSSPEDWKRNFRVVKAKSQEFGKMFLEEERFDCVVVNYSPLRAYVDYLISELDSAMVRVLQRSIAADAVGVHDFLQEALGTLSKRPQSAEEVAQLGARFAEILAQRDEKAALSLPANASMLGTRVVVSARRCRSSKGPAKFGIKGRWVEVALAASLPMRKLMPRFSRCAGEDEFVCDSTRTRRKAQSASWRPGAQSFQGSGGSAAIVLDCHCADPGSSPVGFASRYRNAEAKNELFSRWSRKSVAELSRIQGQWEFLERMLQEHRDIVSRQD
ncbi:cytoplasmic dynein 2 heavy chain 1 [Ixodes scapularis]